MILMTSFMKKYCILCDGVISQHRKKKQRKNRLRLTEENRKYGEVRPYPLSPLPYTPTAPFHSSSPISPSTSPIPSPSPLPPHIPLQTLRLPSPPLPLSPLPSPSPLSPLPSPPSISYLPFSLLLPNRSPLSYLLFHYRII